MDKNLYTKQNDPEQDINETPHVDYEQKQTKKYRFSHVISGMIGGVIVATLVLLLLLNHNILSAQPKETNTVKAENKEDIPISELISEDEYNPPSISELSNAIVGIINLKQQNIWTPNEEAGTGSGIIYKVENEKAYIVTNNHVVENANVVEVELNNEERVEAKVLGTDSLTDLAVLEIDATYVEYVASLGSSNDLQVGETVIAIGNPISMDFSGTVTKGIVSGLNRSLKVDTNGDGQPDWITEVIQTDAAINPGNSGGALVNSEGKVVGINSMKIAQQSVEGIGFAIPIDSAIPIMEQLESKGEIARPFIGITTVEISQVPFQFQNKINLPENVEGGMVIADVQQNSPASEIGLQQFDVITKINDQEVTSLLDLRKYMYSETSIGEKVKIEFIRDGKQKVATLELTEQEA